MSDNNEQMVNTVNCHQHEEVDYAEPESPTLAVRQSASPTTGPVDRLTDVIEIDNNADTEDMLLPEGTMSTSTDEAPTGGILATTRAHETPSAGFRMTLDPRGRSSLKRRRAGLMKRTGGGA